MAKAKGLYEEKYKINQTNSNEEFKVSQG